jgi:hypothetical protein
VRRLGIGTNHVSEERQRTVLATLRRALDAADSARVPAGAREERLPYWFHAVACRARPAAPLRGARLDQGRFTVRFVVDAEGRPEVGTFAAMPGSDPAEVERVRAALAEWRFTPAVRGGKPVAQVAYLTFRGPNRWRRPVREGLEQRAGEDGMVELRRIRVRGADTTLAHATFSPAEIRAWVDSMRAGASVPLGDGARPGLAVLERTGPRGERWREVAWRGCGGTEVGALVRRHELDELLRQLEAMVWWIGQQDSAGNAYDRRERPRRWDEVDCPADPLPGNPRPLPPGGGESAELYARYVVDGAGAPEPATLEVMPGSDPALVEAFRALLPRLRFAPPTRAGRPVRQVVQGAVVFWPEGTPGTGEH